MELEKMVFNLASDKIKSETAINNRISYDTGNQDEKHEIIVQDAGLVNIYNLRGSQRSSTFRKFFQLSLNVEIPNKTCTFSSNDKTFVLQTSPDEWMILSNYNEIHQQVIELEKKLAKVHFAINNLTDQYQVIYISGEKSRFVLSKGCSIDLDPSVFGLKICAQTTLALTDITIFCTAKNSFTVICRNSYANYLVDWLEDASFDCSYKFLKS